MPRPTRWRSCCPLILFGGGVLGLIVGAMLKSRKPDVYARIGEGHG